jgi:hypothetical protein
MNVCGKSPNHSFERTCPLRRATQTSVGHAAQLRIRYTAPASLVAPEKSPRAPGFASLLNVKDTSVFQPAWRGNRLAHPSARDGQRLLGLAQNPSGLASALPWGVVASTLVGCRITSRCSGHAA